MNAVKSHGQKSLPPRFALGSAVLACTLVGIVLLIARPAGASTDQPSPDCRGHGARTWPRCARRRVAGAAAASPGGPRGRPPNLPATPDADGPSAVVEPAEAAEAAHGAHGNVGSQAHTCARRSPAARRGGARCGAPQAHRRAAGRGGGDPRSRPAHALDPHGGDPLGHAGLGAHRSSGGRSRCSTFDNPSGHPSGRRHRARPGRGGGPAGRFLAHSAHRRDGARRALRTAGGPATVAPRDRRDRRPGRGGRRLCEHGGAPQARLIAALFWDPSGAPGILALFDPPDRHPHQALSSRLTITTAQPQASSTSCRGPSAAE